MRLRTAFATLLGSLALAAIDSAPARADLIYDIDTHINGATPADPQPWMVATFHTVSTGTVKLTIQSNLSSTEYVPNILFNVTPAVNPSSLSFAWAGSGSDVQAVSITHATDNGYNGGSNVKAGLFDIWFQYQTSNAGTPPRFYGGKKSVYTITGTGITENTFLATSSADGGNKGGYYAAADARGIPNGSSGSIGNLGPKAVPEPSTFALAGLGIVALCGYRWRRRSRV
jgi:hypothetical protein